MSKLQFAIAAEAAILAAGAMAETQAARPAARVYGDIRLREEMWDYIPIPTASPNVTRGGYNNSFRLRTRVGAAFDFADCATANIRIANMLYDVTAGAKSFDWPDELVVDNANIELRGLTGDGSRLVLGRQDIFLGSGRLVFEGTPLDASRTTFFDGAFLHQPLGGDFSADLMAVYDEDEDHLAVGNVQRQIRGYSPTADGRDEAGIGLFLNGSALDGALPGSIYYIWKHETSARAADGSDIGNADIHTLGALLRPKFSGRFSGEFEYAREFDPNDDGGISASLAFASLKFTEPSCGLKPFVAANCLYLSGDDPDSGRNESFNPLFSRYPFLSELAIYCYDTEGAGNWNNLIYPHISAGTSSPSGYAFTVTAGDMRAEERNGAGGGRNRGELYMAQVNFPICDGAQGGRGKTVGHLRVEILEPGDYYTSNHTAYYVRWEILVKF